MLIELIMIIVITKEYLITTHRFYFVKFNNRCLVSLIYYLATKHNISNHQPPSPPWSTATTNIINTKKKRRKEKKRKERKLFSTFYVFSIEQKCAFVDGWIGGHK